MKELWKDIKGYNDTYKISNLGNVKSVKRRVKRGDSFYVLPERYVTKWESDNGYIKVCLGNKRKYIHRLIAEYFIPNPLNRLEINHKNGIKSDNRIENLEWCTRSENIKHSFKMGLSKGVSYWGENNPNYKHGKYLSSKLK